MQFYEAVTNQGICQEIDRLCDSDDTSYPRLAKTARVNQAFEELVGKIINADGTWQYDDTNYSTQPRGKGTLVEGQEWYSFASEYLKIEEIHILTTGGLYQKIKQIDAEDLGDMSWEEYFGRDSSGNPLKGLPTHYDILGDSIRLGLAPAAANMTLTNGIQVVFKRTANLFTAVSTTAADTTEPGLPSPYHVLLAYKASLPYCMSYKKDRVGLYQAKILQLESDLIKHFSKRNSDYRPIMTMKPVSFL